MSLGPFLNIRLLMGLWFLDAEDTYRMKDYNIPSSHGGEVRVRTLVPTAFDSDKEHKYPLLIFMHGGGKLSAGFLHSPSFAHIFLRQEWPPGVFVWRTTGCAISACV